MHSLIDHSMIPSLNRYSRGSRRLSQPSVIGQCTKQVQAGVIVTTLLLWTKCWRYQRRLPNAKRARLSLIRSLEPVYSPSSDRRNPTAARQSLPAPLKVELLLTCRHLPWAQDPPSSLPLWKITKALSPLHQAIPQIPLPRRCQLAQLPWC